MCTPQGLQRANYADRSANTQRASAPAPAAAADAEFQVQTVIIQYKRFEELPERYDDGDGEKLTGNNLDGSLVSVYDLCEVLPIKMICFFPFDFAQ